MQLIAVNSIQWQMTLLDVFVVLAAINPAMTGIALVIMMSEVASCGGLTLTDDEEREKEDRIGTLGCPRSSSFGPAFGENSMNLTHINSWVNFPRYLWILRRCDFNISWRPNDDSDALESAKSNQHDERRTTGIRVSVVNKNLPCAIINRCAANQLWPLRSWKRRRIGLAALNQVCRPCSPLIRCARSSRPLNKSLDSIGATGAGSSQSNDEARRPEFHSATDFAERWNSATPVRRLKQTRDFSANPRRIRRWLQ